MNWVHEGEKMAEDLEYRMEKANRSVRDGLKRAGDVLLELVRKADDLEKTIPRETEVEYREGDEYINLVVIEGGQVRMPKTCQL